MGTIPRDGPQAQADPLQAASKAIRYLLIARPLPLPENGQPYGKHTPIIALLSAAFAADGADGPRRLWHTSLRHQDPELTAAVEGRLARAADPSDIKCTDYGNAERLVLRYGHELRYCYPWQSWLVWDGQRWQRDNRGDVERRAKATVQGIYAEASDSQDRERREALAKWALKSEADARIKAMVRLAESEPGIPILPEELDADPFLLNVANGTLDLRTGTLRPHRREDLLTKLAPVAYDPEATCPRWERFLGEIFLQRTGLIIFVRKIFGYSLTGDVSERVLFILHGPGRNGKSTLLEILAELLGDYALRTPTETLMIKHHSSIPNDLAALKGMRVVHASETEEGQRLAEALVKDLTGRDTISARFMRGEFFQFRPVCKLWLRTNHKPVIRGTDRAIWDRVRLLPFDLRIPDGQEDRSLPTQLRAELPGILTWALHGCLAWQTNGLGMPDEVKQATAGYQAEMDVVGDFLDDCCTVANWAKVESTALYKAYTSWCEANSERALKRRAFAAALQERGFRNDEERAVSGRILWTGLSLRATPGDE
jgi:putative DNA primase/helicase